MTSPKPSQDEVFAVSEGDRWFQRNKADLDRFDPALDLPMRLIDLYALRPRATLEIGAANGHRVAALADRTKTRAVAVEPSREAISDGRRQFPNVMFVEATADRIPLEDSFDLVIASGLFCLIDRSTLLRSVAETDRLLCDGGFLVISDFLPSNLLRVRFHHVEDQDVYTYKQSYAGIFLASGLYHMVGLLTGRTGVSEISAETTEDNRKGVWLLQKRLTDHYVVSTFRP